MHEHPVRLKSLFLIRICSRDPEQHILSKHRLTGVHSDQFACSEKLAMALAKCFLVATFFLLQFLAVLLTVFKSFLPFGRFYTLKINLSGALKQSGPLPLPLELLRETFLLWLYQQGPPPPLEVTPSLPSSSRLRQKALESALHGVTIHPVDRAVSYS